MLCCGGAEEEPNGGPPANQFSAPPKSGNNPYSGGAGGAGTRKVENKTKIALYKGTPAVGVEEYGKKNEQVELSIITFTFLSSYVVVRGTRRIVPCDLMTTLEKEEQCSCARYPHPEAPTKTPPLKRRLREENLKKIMPA
ncbi:protein kinase 1 [Striga asiatica]|uniref:Protein kinase 1 n=1 Tax=Striga asiatica TaxID=4170 RepID=A0A5A7R846_STRAF|nr:protein kinase 1 [Striga asiatica]